MSDEIDIREISIWKGLGCNLHQNHMSSNSSEISTIINLLYGTNQYFLNKRNEQSKYETKISP